MLTEYRDVVKLPPSTTLLECEPPFTNQPVTYGDAVLRDEVWLSAFRACACQIEQQRTFYGLDNQLQTCPPRQ